MNERDMQEIFDYFDKDQDGLIDISDIDKVCQMIGLGFQKEENMQFLEQINPNFTKKMDFSTFQQLLKKQVFSDMTQEDIYSCFKVFDKNNSGRTMKKVSKDNNLLSNEEIYKFMKLADPKGEGFFDYDHFIRTLNQIANMYYIQI